MDSVSGVFVPVDVLAEEQDVSIENIIGRIQDGELVGRRQSNGWHVLVRMPPQAAGATAQPVTPRPLEPVVAEVTGPISIEGRADVVLRDIQIDLGTLIWFVIKLAVALAVAGIILGAIGYAGVWLVERFGGGLVDSLLQIVQPLFA